MADGWRKLVRGGLRAVARVTQARQQAPAPTTTPPPPGHVALPDYDGRLRPAYAPALDGDADPGEIVWTWVPYEDDPSRGKDRPVLVVGHDGPWLLGLMLTSKDHSRNVEALARRGRYWMDIGSGDWDSRRRPSEIRLDRVLRLDPARVRREGAVVPRGLFDEIIGSLAEAKGW